MLITVLRKRSFASTAGVDLRFDHRDLAPQFGVGIRRLFGGSSQLVLKDRYAKLFEQFLAYS